MAGNGPPDSGSGIPGGGFGVRQQSHDQSPAGPHLEQQSLGRRCIEGPGEQIALSLTTSEPTHNLQLLDGFDAFSQDFHPQAAPQGDDGRNDGGIVGITHQIADETLVDLKAGEGKTLQVVEGTVAGTEIIDGQTDADPP